MMVTTRLIVISGPIASGKTTTGQAVAAWARERGLSAAAIDMDEVVEMVMGPMWQAWKMTHWRQALAMTGALIDRLTELEVDVVTLAGAFFDLDERKNLCETLKSSPAIRFVTLDASLEETIRRCAADDTRVVTKDPAFVRRIYSTINWKTLPREDLLLSTEKLSTDEVVEAIVADVGLR
jgi:shikimate kinase